MKRKLAWALVVFTGLVMLMLTVLLPFVHPLTWHAFGLYGKAMCSCGSLGALGYRYIQRCEREAERMRRLREVRKNSREIPGPE